MFASFTIFFMMYIFSVFGVLVHAQIHAIFDASLCISVKQTHTHTNRHISFSSVLCCVSQPVLFIHRIMHWARRIEQEIDRVFQHITGAQQLKGVSVWFVVLLILVQHVLNKKCTEHRGQCAKLLRIH